MKTFSLLPLAALITATLAAPTPSTGVSFPITDLIDSDLTVEEYAQQLEGQSTTESALAKRQYSGTTYNQLTDGTACRDITVIYARGTTQAGNVGDVGSEGPTFLNALASRLGGTSRLAIQGVTYPANVLGFLAGGDAAGATTMFNLINTVRSPYLSMLVRAHGLSRLLRVVHQPKSWCQDTVRVLNSCTLPHKGSQRPMLRESPQVSIRKLNFHVMLTRSSCYFRRRRS